MDCTYHNYQSLNLNGTPIALETPEHLCPYWCYPLQARPIGLEGCILYCFIEDYGEMVFACNPETCADTYVYPLAKTFADFLRIFLACGSANPVEQIVWMDKSQFEEHLSAETALQSDEQKATLQSIATTFALLPMEHPFEYVKALQESFDAKLIQYSDEYYDILGLERPS